MDLKNLVIKLSAEKQEPEWMLGFRLNALEIFQKKDFPNFGPDLSDLDLGNLVLYLTPGKKVKSWKELPKDIRTTYDKIGVPVWERDFLAGVETQIDSGVVYDMIKTYLTDQGVVFLDTDSALKKYPEMFKKYFAKLILPNDNKFAALNSAFWSGGSFLYLPKGVKVDMPLQAYFRINAKSFGQFERTLIIAEEASEATYIEGCSAPIYTTNSLHAGVVEIFIKKGAKIKYTTIQNWSNNVYNLVTKRADVYGSMSWLDVNIGSKMTMKYPSCLLNTRGASGEMVSLSIANNGQSQDSGAKMEHHAPHTSSTIISKSISTNGGKNTFRGNIKIDSKAHLSKTKTRCDSLILGKNSSAVSLPQLNVNNPSSVASHEATISKIEDEQIEYLQNRGLSKRQAESLIINGFAQNIIEQLPTEYSLEIKRLLELL